MHSSWGQYPFVCWKLQSCSQEVSCSFYRFIGFIVLCPAAKCNSNIYHTCTCISFSPPNETHSKENIMVLPMTEAAQKKLPVTLSPLHTLGREMGPTIILPALRWVITRNGSDRGATATVLRPRESTLERLMMVLMQLCGQLRLRLAKRLLCLHQVP